MCETEQIVQIAKAVLERKTECTVIERAELERLRALERKIEAFFQDIHFDGGSFIVGRTHFLSDDDDETPSAVFRKAFERFEAPGEGDAAV